MAVTFTDVSHTKISKKLRDLIRGEFQSVYISPKKREMTGESIQIWWDTPADELLNASNFFEERRFYLEVKFHYTGYNVDSDDGFLMKRTDKLRKHLNDNIVSDTNWYDLHVNSVEYNTDDSYVLLKVSMDNYTQG